MSRLESSTDPPLSPYYTSPRTSNSAHRATRVKKNTLQPKSPNPRRATNMRFSTKGKSRKESGLVRPVPKASLFVDPFKMHPPTGLKTSISAPIQMLHPDDEENSIIRNAIPIHRAPESQASPEDINTKIGAMLAAHRELKGDDAPNSNTPPSETSRIVSKVFSVFNISNKKDRDKEASVTPQKQLMPLVDESPTEALQIHLNASRNLHRPKVQRIAGNKIPRKPVPNGGMSIMTPRRTGCAYNAQALHRLTSASNDSEESLRSSSPRDPFSSETGFEDDLEHRILKATPDGSSTPRRSRGLRHTADSGGSPKKKTCAQTTIQSQTAQSHTNQSHHAQRHPVQKLPASQTPRASISSHSDSSVGTNSIVDMIVDSTIENNDTQLALPEDFHGEPRRKKHPSPGILWFENLDVAMITHSNLQPEGATKDQLDELAYGISALSSLKPRHGNRPGAANASDQQISSGLTNRQSRLPRSSGSPVPCQTRAIQRMRPNDERADEVDELS